MGDGGWWRRSAGPGAGGRRRRSGRPRRGGVSDVPGREKGRKWPNRTPSAPCRRRGLRNGGASVSARPRQRAAGERERPRSRASRGRAASASSAGGLMRRVMCMKMKSYLRVGVACSPRPPGPGAPGGRGRLVPARAPPLARWRRLRLSVPPIPPRGQGSVRFLPARAAPAPGSGLGGEGGVGAQLPGAQVDARVPHLLGVQPLLGPHQHLHPPVGPREPVSE